jgi:hypothetical protein
VEVPEADLPTYADDTNVIAAAAHAYRAAVVLKRESAKIGVNLSSKCYMTCLSVPADTLTFPPGAAVTGCAPASTAEPAPASAAPPIAVAAPNGNAILGTPVGRDAFVLDYVRKKLAPALEAMRLLPQLGNTQVAVRILCASILPRPRFLASTLGTASLAIVFPEWDAAVSDCVAALFDGQRPPRCFASGSGCLGLPPMAREHAQNRVNGWLRSSTFIQSCMTAANGYASDIPALTVASATSAHPVHVAVNATWDALPNEAKAKAMEAAELPPTATFFELQNKIRRGTRAASKAQSVRDSITKAANGRWRSEVFDSLDTLGQLLMLQSSGAFARAALDVNGTFPADRLTNEEAKVAFLVWLGSVQPCLAATPLAGGLGRELLSMFNIEVHDSLCEVLERAAPAAGLRVTREVGGLFGDKPGTAHGALRRMDLVLQAAAVRVFVDVTKQNGATPAFVARAGALLRPLSAIAAAERAKIAHYSDMPIGWQMMPFAIGCQGETGPWADALLGQLALRTAQRQAGGEEPAGPAVARCLRVLARAVQITLWRGQARQILAFVDGSLPAALHAARAAQAARQRSRWGPSGRHIDAQRCFCDAATCFCGADRAPRVLPPDHPAALSAAAADDAVFATVAALAAAAATATATATAATATATTAAAAAPGAAS